MLFVILSNQLFRSGSEQTAVESQQGEKDRLTCAVVQYGFNNVLNLKGAFLIMKGLRNFNV